MNLTGQRAYTKGKKRKPRVSKAERSHPAFKYGTDEQFLDWLTYQPSCLDDSFNQYIDGIGRNIPCHVRRAGAAGTGFKPPFSAVPMTQAQHLVQSGKPGEVGVLFQFTGRIFSVREAKAWFDHQAALHLDKWIEHRRKEKRIEGERK